jgi:lipopolysaccharide transport system permease protein
MCRRIFDLILFQTYAELKAEATRTYIGLLWWIVEPMIFMMIFYFIFGVLFQRGTDNFIPFLLVGLVVWHWMQATVTQSSNSIVSNRPLIQQVVVPKPLFPTVIILANSIKFVIVAGILITFLLSYGFKPGPSWIYALLVLLVMLLMIAAASFVLAAIVPLIPDIRILIDNGFRALFFLSGIFYDISELPERPAAWLSLNPIGAVIATLRSALLDGQVTAVPLMLGISAGSVLAIAWGLYLMRRNRSNYVKAAM